MSSPFQNMCRTCMVNESKQPEVVKSKVKKKTRMVSILSVPKDFKEEQSLIELLKTSAPQLKIEENDQLPKIVCLECSEKIKELYRFQQNSLNVEQKFYKMLEHANDTFDDNGDDIDIFKTEFDNTFIEENSMESDEDLIVEDDIKMESVEKDEFTGNCSDLSIDFVWDEKSDSDWEDDKPLKSKSKKTKKSKTQQNKLIGDKLQNHDILKPTKAKSSVKEKKSNTTRVYPCDLCNRILKSELSLKKHQELHNKPGIYSRTHIGKISHLCSECGKGFTTATGLKQHSFRHIGNNQYPCPDCPRSFATKVNLSNHSNNIHKALPKKHICDICERGFKTKYLLKEHKRYHSSEKPFHCEYCEKRFVTKDKLKRHTRIHTGEKPYKCNYCEKAYCQSNELTKHLHCHLGENVYQCELCPLRFPNVKIVREHYQSHKNDDEETRCRNLSELNAMEVKGVYIK